MTITLITGGNKGLGHETARRLHELGHTVVIGARDASRGATAAAALGVDSVVLDVTSDDSVAAAAATLWERYGHIDVLVNNAGITGERADVAETTGPIIAAVLDTNVVGPVRMLSAFLPLLAESTDPVVVNVSSGLGSFAITHDPDRIENTVPGPSYMASKAALNMLTTVYARFVPGVKFNVVDPGYTATDLNGNSGHQTVTEGTDAIVAMATIGADGPTGTFSDRDGVAAW